MRRRRSFSMAAVRSAPTRPSLSSASGRGMRTRLVLRHLDRGNQRGDYRGNEPDMRLARLRQFWKQSTSSFRWPALDFGDDIRRLFNYTSAISSLLSGQPGFFQPRFIPPFCSRTAHPARSVSTIRARCGRRWTRSSISTASIQARPGYRSAPSTFVWATSFISSRQR